MLIYRISMSEFQLIENEARVDETVYWTPVMTVNRFKMSAGRQNRSKRSDCFWSSDEIPSDGHVRVMCVCDRVYGCAYDNVWWYSPGALWKGLPSSLHVRGLRSLLWVSVRAAGVDQHRANVSVPQTVQQRVQQGASSCRHQGGIGVERGAGRVS